MARSLVIWVGVIWGVCLLAAASAEAHPGSLPAQPGQVSQVQVDNFLRWPYRVISDANNTKWSPAVVYNPMHEEYLVVWENFWPDDKHDIYARRINNAGQFASDPFVVTSGDENRMQPAVAYDSTHDQYLVVWSVDFSGDGSDWDIYGRFIPWNGPSSEKLEFGIENSRANTGKPRLVYGQTFDKFLVVWKIEGTPSAIGGGFIYDSMGGQIVPVSSTSFDHDFPDVAYNLHRNEFVVVWNEWGATQWDVWGLRLNASGEVLDPFTQFRISNGTLNELRPTVAACHLADQYFIAWQNQVSATDDHIFGRWMDGGGVMTQIYGIEGTSLPQQFPRAACNWSGSQYLLTWQDQYADPYLMWGIWAKFVNTNHTVNPPFEVVAPSDIGNRLYPAAAYGRNTVLVVWQHQRESAPQYRDIWGQLGKPNAVYLPIIRR